MTMSYVQFLNSRLQQNSHFENLENLLNEKLKIKHEYLRSRASRCLSLLSASASSDSYLSIKSLTYSTLNRIEILVLISWIPASENFSFRISSTESSAVRICLKPNDKKQKGFLYSSSAQLPLSEHFGVPFNHCIFQ